MRAPQPSSPDRPTVARPVEYPVNPVDLYGSGKPRVDHPESPIARRRGTAPCRQRYPVGQEPEMTGPRAHPIVDPRMLRLLGFEDLHVGMRESLMKTVMDSDVVGFARLSG